MKTTRNGISASVVAYELSKELNAKNIENKINFAFGNRRFSIAIMYDNDILGFIKTKRPFTNPDKIDNNIEKSLSKYENISKPVIICRGFEEIENTVIEVKRWINNFEQVNFCKTF